jgi:hypothetical protein
LVSITKQKDARKVRDLHFCYLCGVNFKDGDEANYDHVPPEKIFVAQDRNFPLKLKTHKDPCHSQLNLDDEVIAQLISLIHRKQPSARDDRLKIKAYQEVGTDNVLAAFDQKNIDFLIWRWLKAFHAALYQNPIPEETRKTYAMQTPFPSGRMENGYFVVDPILEQHYAFVSCIKRNRVAGTIDRVESNNGKLKYECVWDQLNDNSWCCVFALNLYNWKDLGDIKNFPARGCAGMYRLPNGLAPLNASLATKSDLHIENIDTADPFSL